MKKTSSSSGAKSNSPKVTMMSIPPDISIPNDAPAWAVALLAKTDSTISATITSTIKALLEPITKDIADLRKDKNELTKTVQRQKEIIDNLRDTTQVNKERLINLEMYSMRENIIITGIEDIGNETEDSLYDTAFNINRAIHW